MKILRQVAGLVAVFSLVSGGNAFAQPKPEYTPSSSHIFPAGARRGTTVKVRVGAECIPPGTDFVVTGNGISKGGKLTDQVNANREPSPKREPTITPITYPREWASQLTINTDAQLGAAYWRVNCAQGGTSSRPFLIGETIFDRRPARVYRVRIELDDRERGANQTAGDSQRADLWRT